MHFDCDVSDKQHSELLDLVWSINKNGSKAIDELCSKERRFLVLTIVLCVTYGIKML